MSAATQVAIVVGLVLAAVVLARASVMVWHLLRFYWARWRSGGDS